MGYFIRNFFCSKNININFNYYVLIYYFDYWNIAISSKALIFNMILLQELNRISW